MPLQFSSIELQRDHHHGEPDDVEVGYPPPQPPSTTKAQIYNHKDFTQVEQHVRKVMQCLAHFISIHKLSLTCKSIICILEDSI